MTKVGFIGLGAMGAPMAGRLLAKGFDLTVHNRTQSKEKPLAAAGASVAPTPRVAAQGAEFIITIVSDTSDVEEVIFGANGVAQGAQPGSVVIDMSTIDPRASETFARRLEERGIGFLDAPVSGGTEGAKGGTLSIMCGGDRETFQRARPILSALGTTITLVGGPGSGQMTKAINQVIIAGTFLAVAEGVELGKRAGLDMDRVLEAVSAGAAGSWVLSNRSRRMIEGDFPLGFKVSLHRKDLRIALEVAERLGLALTAAKAVADIEDLLIDEGHGEQDMSAISLLAGGSHRRKS